MPKPILERIRKPSYWYKDQLPHWGIGLAVSAGVASGLAYGAGLNPAASAVIGSTVSDAIGYGRELAQNWGDEPAPGSTEDTTIDMVFWTFGTKVGALSVLWA